MRHEPGVLTAASYSRREGWDADIPLINFCNGLMRNIVNIFISNCGVFNCTSIACLSVIVFNFFLLTRLVYVDICFSTIKLKAEDASGREHLITVKLKAKVCALLNCYAVQEIL